MTTPTQTTFNYAAVDSRGQPVKGAIQAADQTEALRRVKEMGFFPLKISAATAHVGPASRMLLHAQRLGLKSTVTATRSPTRHRIKPKRLAVFTRQLATLLEAGLPLLRGLRLLREQETNPPLRHILAELGESIEGGCSFSEALAQHPRTFDRLYLNLVKAGELGGVLEATLERLAVFMEKSERIKHKVKAAMAYPVAVLAVAAGVLALLMIYIVPKFKEVFGTLLEGRPLPAFTRFVFGVSDSLCHHFFVAAIVCGIAWMLLLAAIATRPGRRAFDRFKLRMPVLGPVFRKVAIARFTRTFGTLLGSGVPILQALAIVREATGNVVMGSLVGKVHDSVKQGESVVGPLRNSGIFPAMVAGMVDVGEQTGALPEMLNRIADNYDEEVDNSVAAMTSLLEPIMIVLLALIVGSIVVAIFLPIVQAASDL